MNTTGKIPLRKICRIITFLIAFGMYLQVTGCADTTSTIDDSAARKWQPVPEFANTNIQFMRVIDNTLYVVAKTAGNGRRIYKSSNGNSWELLYNSAEYDTTVYVEVVAHDGKDLILAANRVLYKLKNRKPEFWAKVPYYFLADMLYFQGNIYIAPSGIGTEFPVVNSNGEVHYINRRFLRDCEPFYKTEINMHKIIPQPGTNNLLGSGLIDWAHVARIAQDSIMCFDNRGLERRDFYNGALDIEYIKDTLYAGTFGKVLKYDGNGWKTEGDTLPYSGWGFKIYATAVAAYKEKLAVATNYNGVLQRDAKGSWVELAPGIPVDNLRNMYQSVTNLVGFNQFLFAGFGDRKAWPEEEFLGLYQLK